MIIERERYLNKLIAKAGNGLDHVYKSEPLSIQTGKRVYKNEAYEKVLKEKFQHGFRLCSTVELRRFKKNYAEIHGMDVKEKDEEITRIIKSLCIIYADRAYHPDVMLSVELKTKLFGYIAQCFSEGKTTIYYQALCEEFAEDSVKNKLDSLFFTRLFVQERHK